MYSLSFSMDFFWQNSEYPEQTERPQSVYEALYNMWHSKKNEFNEMVQEVLGYDMPDYLPETTIHELVEKVQEYNTCYNINTPVEVFVNNNFTVKVY